jgi:hypothetical protein
MSNKVHFTDAEVLECLRRELKMRIRVYPQRIQDGKMSRYRANKEYAMMQLAKNIIEEAYHKDIDLRGLLQTLKSIQTNDLKKEIQTKLNLK